MKVLLISGSYPPEVCGIGDYTAALVKALANDGLFVEVLRGVTWKLSEIGRIVAAIKSVKSDVVHLQYPGEGYRWSIAPQIVSLLIPAVVTLHEFSFSRLPRKVACLPLLLFATHIVFTTNYERECVIRMFPWIANKSSVIPIGTNILPSEATVKRSSREVVYFGLIAPNKGLEQVIEFAEIAKRSEDGIRVRIVGRKVPRFQGYAHHLVAKSANLPITFELDKSASDVAEILAGSSVAFLPFPDGASERRGSLKAVLASGVVCISTAGCHTPESLRSVLVMSESAQDAYMKAKALFEDSEEWKRIASNIMNYTNLFRWESIADMHCALYFRLSQ